MDLLLLIIFILPAYVANSVPVLFKGKTPIDMGNFIGTQRLFGDNKTYKGFAAGVLGGIITGLFLAYFAGQYYLPGVDNNIKYAVILALSIGTLVGDLAGSFAKRRLGLAPGSSSIILDQLPFLLVALLFSLLPYPQLLGQVTIQDFAFLVVLTIVLHGLFNLIAHRLNLKKVPW